MNGADMIVAIAVGIMVLLAAAIIRRNRRNGKSSCGCQCSDCGYGCGNAYRPVKRDLRKGKDSRLGKS